MDHELGLGDLADSAAISFGGLSLNLEGGLGAAGGGGGAKTRVRKAYSGRSSNCFPVESIVVGKQKLRGPSGAHLPQEEVVRPIFSLNDEKTRLDKLDKELSELSLTAPKFGGPKTSSLQALEHTSDPVFSQAPSPASQIPALGPMETKAWTAEEDALLRKAIDRFGEKNWKDVATLVPGRTSTQCVQRWKSNLKPGFKKGQWSRQEDSLLIEQVQASLAKQVKRLNWGEISRAIPKRGSKQCRERWVNHLNPDVNKGEWTAEEDEMLWEFQKEMPRKWAHLARKIPGRTENQVKVRWNILNRHRQRYGGGRPEDLRKKAGSSPRSKKNPAGTTSSSSSSPSSSIAEKTKKLANKSKSAPPSSYGDFANFIGIKETQMTYFGPDHTAAAPVAPFRQYPSDQLHMHQHHYGPPHALDANHLNETDYFMPPPASLSFDAHQPSATTSDFADTFSALPSNSSFRHSFKDFSMRELADEGSASMDNLFADLDML